MALDQISKLYQDVLGREADTGGLDYWTNQLNSGTPLESIRNAFMGSQEYQQKQQQPQEAPKVADVGYVPPTAGPQTAVEEPKVADVGYVPPTAGPKSTDVVSGFYNQYLGREADQGGLDYWSNLLSSGQATPQQVQDAISGSSEAQARSSIQNAFKTSLGREADQAGLDYWTQQVASGALTPEAAAQQIAGSAEGIKYNAPKLVEADYQQYLGRPADEAGAAYWTEQLQSGAMTPEQVADAIKASSEGTDYGAMSTAIGDLYKTYLGRDIEQEGLQYWADKINKGEMSWNDLVKNIKNSDESKTYAEKLYQDKLANPIQYFGSPYARDQWGNLIQNQGTDEYGNPITVDGYQRGNYGFDTGYHDNESWEQNVNRINGYYGDAVGKMYQGILGRPVTQDELNGLLKNYTDTGNGYNTGQWTDLDLARIQKDLALSPEAQAYAAKNGTWLTVTKDQTIQKSSSWNPEYKYDVTEPVTKAVYIPPSVAGLPEAMRQIYNSDNPQALIDQIKNDPAGWMKNQLANYAYTVGVNQRVAGDNRYEASSRWSSAYSNEGTYDKNAQMQNISNLANDTAKWLLDNNAITREELANLWTSKMDQGGNDIQKSLDTIHEDSGGFWSGEWLGDFLEKYEVPIMATILGGAVLGPAAIEAGGLAAGSAGAIATQAGVSGLTSTAVALASGAPTNKALIAGGLAAAGAGLGGALGPSGLDLAGKLTTELGLPPVLSAVAVGALSGGALGGLSGSLNGTGALEGALGGALAGGITSGTSAATKTFDGMTGTLARLAAGTAVGMLTGKDISAALQGAAVGTVVGLAGSATKSAIDAAKSGKTDITVDGKITPNAETVDAMRKAAEDELNGMLGNSDPESVKKYVASLPESYFTDALNAVDTEVANSIKLAASYPTEAVKELYKDDLGREPDAEGLKYYADGLRNGSMTLEQIQSEIKNSPEGLQYAALNTGTMTDASGDSEIPKNLDEQADVVVEGDKSFNKVGGTAYTGEDNKLYTPDSSGKMVEFTPDLAKTYNDSISKFQGYLDSGTYNGQPLTQTQIDAATQSINNWKQDLAAYTANEIQTASPQELQSPSLWQKIIDDGASLFTFGTPGEGGVAITGSGASGNEPGSKFSLFAFDGDQQKQQMVVYLEQATKNPDLTPEQKAVAEKVLEDAKNTEVKPKTSGGSQSGSTTTETPDKPGGDTGGGGTSTSVAPSGKPGASAEAIDAALNAITTTTLTSQQVQELTNPSSATAQAAASLVPGSLSIAKISSDVNAMYQTLLGRDAEKEGLDYWSKLIQDGKMTLADVASTIANSQEAKNKAGSGTGTTTSGTGTGTAGTGTSTGTTGTGTGTGGGTGGGAGTGTGTGTGAGEGTGSGTGTGSSTGSGTGGSGTGTGGGTGGGTGSGGTGGGTSTGGGGTSTGGGGTTYIPSLNQGTSGLNTKFPNLTADVVGGGATIDLGGEFGAPVISSMSYTPIGGLTYATGGSVDPLDTSEEISADTSDQSSGADVITGGTTAIDLGGEFAKTPTTYNVSTGAKNYADGGIIGGDSGGMVFEGGWPAMQLARMRANRFKQLANVPQVSGTAFAQGGHVPEFYSEGGLNNRYVTGNGDGTSDDVPAMLANGEFVIPADVVSALGNGSNDSGASILDEFLQVIRAHKQNHDPKQLPPDSLGPLAYLNKATKKAGK